MTPYAAKKIAEEISKTKDWFASYEIRQEVTKIITEPVVHLCITDAYYGNEFDVKRGIDDWLITCESADLKVILELKELLDKFWD
mgnify:FL=1